MGSAPVYQGSYFHRLIFASTIVERRGRTHKILPVCSSFRKFIAGDLKVLVQSELAQRSLGRWPAGEVLVKTSPC